MKILHAINFMGTGGVESFLINLISEQSKTHDVSLLTILDKNSYMPKDVFPGSVGGFIELKLHRVIDFRALFRLRRVVKKINPDIVHVHLFPAQLIVPIALLGLKVKVVTTEHGISLRRIKYPMFHYLEWIGFYLYSRIIGVSLPVSDNLASEYPGFSNKIVTINNGIDIDEVASAKPVSKGELSASFCDDDIVVCMVGRLEVGKDYETLIKAMNDLPDNFKLLIVGEGYNRGSLEKFVCSQGLTDRVVFFGFNKNIYFIYKSIDIFVLSSEREGLPMVLLEAMAAGKPCIGSNVDGIKNILGREEVLFSYKDASDLAKKISSVSGDLKRYSDFSKNKIVDYSFDKMFSQYEKIYKDTL